MQVEVEVALYRMMMMMTMMMTTMMTTMMATMILMMIIIIIIVMQVEVDVALCRMLQGLVEECGNLWSRLATKSPSPLSSS